MSADDWEQFVQEWASSALATVHGYSEVHRSGSAGDMGRDVIAYLGSTDGPYDNYQCKHYDHALHPGDIWSEIGKLCYWTFEGAYSLPEKYRFVAPLGAGTSLLRLLEKPAELKRKFIEAWDKSCADAITGKTAIPLTPELRAHIESIDFSIFGAVPPVTIIEEHSTTPFHIVRFGGGLPGRKDDAGPPDTISEHESRYVRQLLDAYEEHAGCALSCLDDLASISTKYSSHMKVSREEFFSAECLNKFSRDYLPSGCFEELQRDIEDGVREVATEDYDKGLDRLKATVKHAKLMPIEGHPLRDVSRPRDKAGVCHQLANEDRLIWVLKENDGD